MPPPRPLRSPHFHDTQVLPHPLTVTLGYAIGTYLAAWSLARLVSYSRAYTASGALNNSDAVASPCCIPAPTGVDASTHAWASGEVRFPNHHDGGIVKCQALEPPPLKLCTSPRRVGGLTIADARASRIG